MATIELRLSTKKQKETKKKEVLLRVRLNGTKEAYAKTGKYIDPKFFKFHINRKATKAAGVNIPEDVDKADEASARRRGYILSKHGEIDVRSKIETPETLEARNTQNEVKAILLQVEEQINSLEKKDTVTSEWLQQIITPKTEPETDTPEDTFFSLAETFLKRKEIGDSRKRAYNVFLRHLARFEAVEREIMGNKDYKINIHTFSDEDAENFKEFLLTEHTIKNRFPVQYAKILKEYPNSHVKGQRAFKVFDRGDNGVVKIMKMLKAIFRWLYENEYTDNKKWEKIDTGTEKYGTPYYLTIEERDKIANFDLSTYSKHIQVQRDIFIFQCFVACRVSDLMSLTSENITQIGQTFFLEYIPHKTKDQATPQKARIPLSEKALALVAKYDGVDKRNRLFPFIAPQNYNDTIKEILTICEITRSVQIRNTKTGEYETRPINEIASSHMARRTFVGTMYNQIADPNIIGAMSGHTTGSKAFARYRNIENDLLVKAIKTIS